MLALETSTAACSVALSVHGVVHVDHRIEPRQHNRLILSMIDALLRSAGVDRRELDAVAFGRGPGSFTGVRIAASIAQGVSLGLSIPVVPVSSLEALAHAARVQHPRARGVLATIRSRADEIYAAGYRFTDRQENVFPESVATATQREMPSCVDSTWCVVGDGIAHFSPSAELCCTTDAELLPNASGVLALATQAFADGQTVAAAQALPVYLQGTRPWRKLSD